MEILVPLLSVVLHLTSAALQPDNVDSGEFDNLDNNVGGICTRTCGEGEPPMVCYYKFVLENYNVLTGACGNCPSVPADCFQPQCVTADGFERAILTVNRKLPGPSIQVCKGDTIVVDLMNKLKGSYTTLHWHGIRQRNSPWMDGVPMVTQCPISEGQTFRYNFVAKEAGTFWYHSHSGLQKSDGLVGGIVVRQPESEELLSRYYDLDLPSHLMVVQDWTHATSFDLNPGLLHKNLLSQYADTCLINGRGVNLDSTDPGMVRTPLSVFHVEMSKRYRFRIVGATSLVCLFRVSFQGHRLLVVSGDDKPIQPVNADSIIISSGERYDVVIETNQTLASYWIIVQGLDKCFKGRQLAVLQYMGANVTTNLPSLDSDLFNNKRPGVTVNAENSPCTDSSLPKDVCVSQLSSLTPTPPDIRNIKPDTTIVLKTRLFIFNVEELFQSNTFESYISVRGNSEKHLLNNISYAMPPSPLLTQLSDIPQSSLCSSCQDSRFCECTHLIKVPFNSVVEFVVDNTDSPVPHPVHIHGYDFYVLEQARNTTVTNLYTRLGQRSTIRDFLPMKDTVLAPANGYTVTRILADNPGFWFLHCHFQYHIGFGMAAVIQVGEPEDMLPPPENFPMCGSFTPPTNGL